MVKITYVVPDGSTHVLDVPEGKTVMEGSVENNLPGIVAECGGSCSCATCHVYLDDEFADLFDEPADEERELLEFAEGATPQSRLACQLIVTEACDGVRVVARDNAG